MLSDILIVLQGYLLGSISTAIIVGKLLNTVDPRTVGSGNPGATNMLRVGGKKAGALTLIGDMLKGLIAVLIAHAFHASPEVQALTALAAFLGHLYPVFFGFKGGKGVATALGVLLGLHWLVGLAVIGTWLAMAFIFRISSLSALVASALAPAWLWWQRPEPFMVACMGLMSIMLFWRHRSNIKNLLAGKEDKIGTDKK